mmetsp:Transcript_7148/g.15500  ORF Transcript_7148/g.15500 Transcript_7148/m.15500 type:complete len:234 (+) Transcript_7148:268-969(+)
MGRIFELRMPILQRQRLPKAPSPRRALPRAKRALSCQDWELGARPPHGRDRGNIWRDCCRWNNSGSESSMRTDRRRWLPTERRRTVERAHWEQLGGHHRSLAGCAVSSRASRTPASPMASIAADAGAPAVASQEGRPTPASSEARKTRRAAARSPIWRCRHSRESPRRASSFCHHQRKNRRGRDRERMTPRTTRDCLHAPSPLDSRRRRSRQCHCRGGMDHISTEWRPIPPPC